MKIFCFILECHKLKNKVKFAYDSSKISRFWSVFGIEIDKHQRQSRNLVKYVSARPTALKISDIGRYFSFFIFELKISKNNINFIGIICLNVQLLILQNKCIIKLDSLVVRNKRHKKS